MLSTDISNYNCTVIGFFKRIVLKTLLVFTFLEIFMAIQVSKMYGLSIYDDNGAYLGKAYDLILNLESGDVVRITTEPLKDISDSKEDMNKVIQQKSILFKRVKSVKDIVVVGRKAGQ